MDQLLPYYERELGFLRRYSRDFAERYPKIAGQLSMAGEVCEDPHIERMIQSFALLSSRIAKRLDDSYPEFTEALFESLYPHYLQPFPSCSIARIDSKALTSQLTSATCIPRGTEMETKPIKKVVCKFRTVYDVSIAPVKVASAGFDPILAAPDGMSLPAQASSKISIRIELTNDQLSFAQIKLPSLRLFIDGEASFCAGLRDTLFMRGVGAYLEALPGGGAARPLNRGAQWQALPTTPIAPVGFTEEEALIPFDARSHPAYRLLTEYFAFPEKFNFFSIDLPAITALLPPGCRAFTLHLLQSGMRSDSNQARLLSTLNANNLLANCTPMINLFQQRGDPIQLTQTTSRYPVLGDGRNAHGYEVHSIDSVKMVRQTAQGESVTEFRPLFSLRHAQSAQAAGHYWILRRDALVAEYSPGYEAEISLVDIDFDPAAVETDTLSLELTCCNRDLPTLLGYGLPEGDLSVPGGGNAQITTFLRKPTPALRFDSAHGAHWRLVSHLSLNHLSLAQGGLDALQEMLGLYDLPRSPISQRQISGIVAIEHRAANAWLPGNPFPCLVRGIEVRITIDEENFVGSGIHAFGHLLDCFFGLYVNANSFTQLVLLSKKTGEPLLTCAPRSGDLALA